MTDLNDNTRSRRPAAQDGPAFSSFLTFPARHGSFLIDALDSGLKLALPGDWLWTDTAGEIQVSQDHPSSQEHTR